VSSPCHTGPGVLPAELEATTRTVALVGPPNSGKTTLFNRLTGLRQKVGNFPGVTVEHHTGVVRGENGKEAAVIDLPGIYSLVPVSEDERVTVDVLEGRMDGIKRPDAVVVVTDATNLSHHLVLAARIISIGLPTLIVLNMADELKKQGGSVDVLSLARQLGTPVVLASAATGDGVPAILNFLTAQTHSSASVELPVLKDAKGYRDWAVRVGNKASYRKPATPVWTQRLDRIFLHRIWGPVIFAVTVLLVFQVTFTVGQGLSALLQQGLQLGGKNLGRMLPDGMFQSFLIDGIWNGVGSVLVFLPQILILFLVIGILEDSGYLARAAVIADQTMSRVGLNGKSFIPLLSAYACAVPAIMATRTIPSKRDRIATILIAPFMTCSARLPVYTMFIAAFIPAKPLLGPFFGARAAAMLSLYVLGFLMAVFTARILKSTILKSDAVHFVMEMPPYRWPTASSLGLRLLDRSKVFMVRAGTIILAVAIVLWVLTNFPMEGGKRPAIENSYVASIGHAIEPAIRPMGFDWKIGVGLVSSIAAREGIIATLGTLYGIDPEEHAMDLQAALHRELSFAGAVALLLFFAFAMQCASTIAVVRRETNSWKWPALQFGYMTAVAYVSALVAYTLLK
jgi:ferrous iron transport protein B